MNIHSHLLFWNAISLDKKSVIQSLTAQQKKILTIVSLVFGCLATCYLIRRYLETKKIHKIEEIKEDLMNSSKSVDITKFLPNNEEILKGTCIEGELNGLGKILRRHAIISDGKVKNIVPDSNDIYSVIEEGGFNEHQLDGEGTIVCYKNKQTLEILKGQFKKGVFIKGKRFCPGGPVYEGEFKGDKLHGQGSIIWPDKRIERGLFQDGEFIQVNSNGISEK